MYGLGNAVQVSQRIVLEGMSREHGDQGCQHDFTREGVVFPNKGVRLLIHRSLRLVKIGLFCTLVGGGGARRRWL